jgi:hypothetical protein
VSALHLAQSGISGRAAGDRRVPRGALAARAR